MYSRAGIGMLRELRSTDPIGWLKPDDYLYFVNQWAFIERTAKETDKFFVKNFGTTGLEILDDMYRNVDPSNLNPNNRLGLPRYSWSDDQYARLQSSKIRRS